MQLHFLSARLHFVFPVLLFYCLFLVVVYSYCMTAFPAPVRSHTPLALLSLSPSMWTRMAQEQRQMMSYSIPLSRTLTFDLGSSLGETTVCVCASRSGGTELKFLSVQWVWNPLSCASPFVMPGNSLQQDSLVPLFCCLRCTVEDIHTYLEFFFSGLQGFEPPWTHLPENRLLWTFWKKWISMGTTQEINHLENHRSN